MIPAGDVFNIPKKEDPAALSFDISRGEYCAALFISYGALGDIECVHNYAEYSSFWRLKGYICTKKV
ncbi:hypothetical protein TELCIR_20136 [Teladorsagia circumcincta]|uniref:Uncharacterized protein n=1 Tax=Teladorsagia circumcincta TaxID=45464 RepID=A0A2G9TM70_TELCI|nr:hypothetical protein TELCIR_20136 [Teladorsagia circumcincta]